MLTLRKAVRDALEKDIEVLREQKDMLIHEIEKLRKTYKDIEKGEAMKKSDLKTGMVVECRSGDKFMYLKTEDSCEAFIAQECYLVTDNFTDDLKSMSFEKYDIMKIYQADRAYQPSEDCWNRMQLVWERQEPRKMTLAEIEKELGYPVEVEESECLNS